MQILTYIAITLIFTVTALSQLPDKGEIADIKGKTKTYLSTDAKHEKALVKEIAKNKFILVSKPDDADFIITYTVTEMRYVTAFHIPVETGQMDVYFVRDDRKVVVWSESNGNSSKGGPSVGLLKKFIKAYRRK